MYEDLLVTSRSQVFLQPLRKFNSKVSCHHNIIQVLLLHSVLKLIFQVVLIDQISYLWQGILSRLPISSSMTSASLNLVLLYQRWYHLKYVQKMIMRQSHVPLVAMGIAICRTFGWKLENWLHFALFCIHERFLPFRLLPRSWKTIIANRRCSISLTIGLYLM